MASEPAAGAGWVRRIIDGSLARRGWVLAGVALLTLLAGWRVTQLKLDALPDLSETQVIVKAEWPGQPPQLIEDQITYPLTAALLGVPGASSVRGFSMFGEAFVYVVFADGVDPYWARARLSERLSQLAGRWPPAARVNLGPDASGTGWVLQYALVGNGTQAIDRLRAIQDTQLRPALQALPGVAEIATFGGSARQLQVDVDAARMQALGVSFDDLAAGVRDTNRATGGGAVEVGRQRHLIRTDARIRGADDLLQAVVARSATGVPIRLHQVANVSTGPVPGEGVGYVGGSGETVGGIVVMRQHENAADTIHAVKQRLESLAASLPKGVEVRVTYDRGTLIDAAVRSLGMRLLEEGLVVAVVCAAFLWRWRSALVAIISLPVGLLVALAVLERQGVTANIMSLGGLAVAIGAMIDAAVVMVETLHRKLERRAAAGDGADHWALVREAASEVGPALFFSLLIITVSFLPVLSLQGQEGRLFAPLALTKTYAMAAATGLSVSLVPVLMGLIIRGRLPREHRNPLNRWLKRLYRPVLRAAIDRSTLVVTVAVLVSLSGLWPLARMGSEFMPPLDEGDLLYMPTTLPSISVGEAADLLRRTSELIGRQPEVASVHGKAGRSDSATDPAPLSMFETTVVLKPRAQWPDPGLSREALVERLDGLLRWPGLSGSWGYPIRTRIDMLSTGVKTPLALRISGPETADIEELTARAETVLRRVPGVRAVFAERTGAGRYIDVKIDRAAASLYGLKVSDIAQLIEGPVAAMPIDTVFAGRERYPLVLRVGADARGSVAALGELRLSTPAGGSVSLSQVATLSLVDGATEIRSENARPVGYVLLDLSDADIGGVLERASAALDEAGLAREGYSLDFVGQYLRLQQAASRLVAIAIGTLALVVLILYIHFRSGWRVGVVMAGLPAAASGGLWLCHLLGQQWSFATVVGLLALAGVAAEFCVVMLLYLDQERVADARRALRLAVIRGALMRLRPKMMTVSVILAGLVPLLLSDGVGVDVMRRIAAPMVGGMLLAPLYSLLVVPTLYLLLGAGDRTEAGHG